MNNRYEIFEYIYRGDVPKSRNTRIGVLVAKNVQGEVHFGWSRCNVDAGDTFNHVEGFEQALKNLGKPLPISFSRRKQINNFRARAARYFQNLPIPTWNY